MERNFETVMIEQCAPVLAGLKPARLFRYETRDCADPGCRVRRWNDQLGEEGLRRSGPQGLYSTHRYLIYVYRESRLRRVLADEAVQEFLQREGLCPAGRCFRLTVCFCGSCPGGCAAKPIFPHEIGVFLGYPLTDVGTSHRKSRRNFTCCGCWKLR